MKSSISSQLVLKCLYNTLHNLEILPKVPAAEGLRCQLHPELHSDKYEIGQKMCLNQLHNNKSFPALVLSLNLMNQVKSHADGVISTPIEINLNPSSFQLVLCYHNTA